MPEVTVRYFAVLRERRGRDEERVEVAGGATVAELYEALFPGPERVRVGYVRNLEVVPPETVVGEGDEIGFLPPLGGG